MNNAYETGLERNEANHRCEPTGPRNGKEDQQVIRIRRRSGSGHIHDICKYAHEMCASGL